MTLLPLGDGGRPAAMTPMEKAEEALNRRIEELQQRFRQATSDASRRHLVQSIVVCVSISECITDYVRAIQQYAQNRYGELKKEQADLTTRHADLLTSGHTLLERLKAAPNDRALRSEIETTQREMAAIQKTLRRKADALQREVSPPMRLLDEVATGVCRLCGAEEKADLKRTVKTMVGHVQELYRTHPLLPSSGIIDGASWEASALAALDEATEFHDCYARAGFQMLLALEVMTMAVSPRAPQTPEEATQRANEAVAQRVRKVTERFTSG